MKASTLSVWAAIAGVAITMVVETMSLSTKFGVASQKIEELQRFKDNTPIKLEKITDLLTEIQKTNARLEQKVDDIRGRH
jgi:peptidoglycan hydrolase CwlO-like protein